MGGITVIKMNVYDLETFENNSKIVPYCACLILYNKTYSIYYDSNKNLIIESLILITNLINTSKIEFYIHNLNFDGILIINEISKFNINYTLMSNKTNIYYLDVFYFNKLIRFRCSYKLMPLSLEKIGEIENFPKKFFPHKFVSYSTLFYIGPYPDKKYWENTINNLDHFKIFDLKKEIIAYCLNDVLLTSKFLENIIKIVNNECVGIINSSYSLASISFKLFYKKYNIKNIPPKIYKKNDNYIRNAYYGGRCEIYGNPYNFEIIKYYDFTGMYAQCMLECFHNEKAKYLLDGDYNMPGFHSIEFESNINFLPVLPSHSENGKLLFLNGKGVGTYWFEEIQLFVKMGGRVNKILNSYIYEKYEKVFTNFIEQFSKIREKGGYYNVLGKLIINSLYGGMALNDTQEKLYITFSEIEFYSILEKLTVTFFYKLNNSFILIIKEDYKSKKFFNIKNSLQSTNRNVSYAAAIAAKARIKLYNAMQEVMQDGGRLLYCDTDSIFAAYNNTNISKKCTNFDWLEFYEDAVFIAPKTYALKNIKSHIKIKGVTFKNISFEELKLNFYNEKKIIFTDQLNIKKYNFELKQTYINKEINLNSYDKRIFINNKKSTLPLRIDK